MRIIVTGASGNIGTALLRRLAGSGHAIVGVSRRTPPRVAPYQDVEWASVDVAGDEAATELARVFGGADAVVHLAWMLQPSHDRDRMRRTNQGGTRAVADGARAAGVAHLVHMSSLGAYSPADRGAWADETWPATGVSTSSYSVDKAAAERIVASYADQSNGDRSNPGQSSAGQSSQGRPSVGQPGSYRLSIVRPSLVVQPEAASEIARYFLGPFVPASVVRPALLRLAPWPRGLTLQLVHADDVADALARILDQKAVGAFNLAAAPVLDRDQVRRSFGGIGPPAPLALLRSVAAATWRLRLQPTDAGWLDLAAAVPLLTSDHARDVLGWQPEHRADELLRTFLIAVGARRGADGPLLKPRRL